MKILDTNKCSSCNEVKPIEEFVNSSVYNRCKECNREAVKGYRFKERYGISVEIYNEMLKEQDNVCAICRNPETCTQYDTIKALSVDHCHETGRVRGLLCHKCNRLLAELDENIDYIESLKSYLVASRLEK